MNRRLYALHRWLAAAAFVQLAVWSVSGAFFALSPMARVHGDGVAHVHERQLAWQSGMLAPTEALDSAARYGVVPTSLELRATPSGIHYLARGPNGVVRLDSLTAAAVPVGRDEAEAIARRDQPSEPVVLEARLLDDAPVEYRGKPLPAWRVALNDGAGTVVYVDARTGDVTARRNDLWRTYDFLWSLHIMDYRGRESFNHPLLIAAAALAVVTVVSGAALWLVRIARRLRRRAA